MLAKENSTQVVQKFVHIKCCTHLNKVNVSKMICKNNMYFVFLSFCPLNCNLPLATDVSCLGFNYM